jgi:Uma2 family endonuclease
MWTINTKGRESEAEQRFSGKTISKKKERKIIYPESDGKPMSDNTKQFEWIVKIKENLEILFADDPDVFVAGDFLWYPTEGNNKLRIAPDAMVVFGRPKGHRGSYLQWKEDGIAPQVVFEILSPGNTRKEMEEKLIFYETYGVDEYYEYDPDNIILKGWVRSGNKLLPIEKTDGWVSPKLKIRFEMIDNELYVFHPNGEKFLTPVESELKHRAENQMNQQKFDAERREKEKFAAKLRELGIDPNTI